MSGPRPNPGLALAYGSALVYTGFDVGIRLFVGDLTVWGLLFMRGFLGGAVVLFLARRLGRSPWGRRHGIFAAAGLCAYLSSAFLVTALATIPLYQAMVLMYIYPVSTLLLAAPINKEPLTARNLYLSGLAFLGCLALVWPDESAGLDFSLGHVAGFCGALFYSFCQVLIRRAGNDNSGLEPIYYYSLFAVCLSYPLALLFGQGFGLDNPQGLATGLGLAVLGVAGQMMAFAALRWVEAFKVGVIGALEIAAGAFLSWLVFSDPISLRTMAGAAIIVFAVVRLRIGDKP